MMPRFLPFLFLLLSYGTFCSAQYPVGLRSGNVRLGLITLVDPFNPGIEITGERRLTWGSSVQMTGALLCDPFRVTPYQDFRGGRFSVAKKWALTEYSFFRWYYAVEFGVSSTQYGSRGRFAIPHSDGSLNVFNHTYHESFTVYKQTAFSNLRAGVHGAVRRIVFDVSAGLGVKYKKTQHQGRASANGVLYPGLAELDPYQVADREKDGIVGNLPLSVSVGYTF